jgi:hypothetical protein
VAEIYLRRTLTGFGADGDDALREIKKFPVGTVVKCEISRPRSLKQLRYYWALCALVASNHAELQTREQVDQTIRILSGHVDTFKVKDYLVQVPKRIAFSQLEQEEWEEYLSRAKDVVLSELLPGVELREFEDEIARMVA